jgi:Flp pilus assembly protein protease CpaA
MYKSILFLLIITTGTLTAFTDLSQKKIKNHHLAIIYIIAIAFLSFEFINKNPSVRMHILSGIIGLTIGVMLFLNKLWRGGDVKLFATYSLLMPATGYERLLPLPCLALFANAFLAGLVFLIPFAILDIKKHHKDFAENLVEDVFSRKFFNSLGFSFLMTLTLSWTIFPLLSMTRIDHYPFLSFLLCYTLFFLLYSFTPALKQYPILIILLFAAGLFLRLEVSPEFFTPGNLIRYIQTLIAYSLIYHFLRKFTARINADKERVPFAPFLFIGCLLSYTPFLEWMMKVLARR